MAEATAAAVTKADATPTQPQATREVYALGRTKKGEAYAATTEAVKAKNAEYRFFSLVGFGRRFGEVGIVARQQRRVERVMRENGIAVASIGLANAVISGEGLDAAIQAARSATTGEEGSIQKLASEGVAVDQKYATLSQENGGDTPLGRDVRDLVRGGVKSTTELAHSLRELANKPDNQSEKGAEVIRNATRGELRQIARDLHELSVRVAKGKVRLDSIDLAITNMVTGDKTLDALAKTQGLYALAKYMRLGSAATVILAGGLGIALTNPFTAIPAVAALGITFGISWWAKHRGNVAERQIHQRNIARQPNALAPKEERKQSKKAKVLGAAGKVVGGIFGNVDVKKYDYARVSADTLLHGPTGVDGLVALGENMKAKDLQAAIDLSVSIDRRLEMSLSTNKQTIDYGRTTRAEFIGEWVAQRNQLRAAIESAGKKLGFTEETVAQAYQDATSRIDSILLTDQQAKDRAFAVRNVVSATQNAAVTTALSFAFGALAHHDDIGGWLKGSYHGGGSGDVIKGCFVAGTLIHMADGTTKPIEQIIVGDIVLSYDEATQQLVHQQVLETVNPVHTQLITLSFSNGVSITNTLDHPYMVAGKGWASFDPEATGQKYGLQVSKLVKGDKVFSYKENVLEEVVVKEIAEISKETQTYNLSQVANTHTFFANGILVHNKSGAVTTGHGPSTSGAEATTAAVQAQQGVDTMHAAASVETPPPQPISLDQAFNHAGHTETHTALGDMNANSPDHFHQYPGHDNSSDQALGTWQGAHTGYSQDGNSVTFYGTYPGAKEFIQVDGHTYWFEPQTVSFTGHDPVILHALDGSQTPGGSTDLQVTQSSFLHMMGYDQTTIKADYIINDETTKWLQSHGWQGTTDASDRVEQYINGQLGGRHPGLEEAIHDRLQHELGITDKSQIHYTDVPYGEGLVNGNHIDILAQNEFTDTSQHFDSHLTPWNPQEPAGWQPPTGLPQERVPWLPGDVEDQYYEVTFFGLGVASTLAVIFVYRAGRSHDNPTSFPFLRPGPHPVLSDTVLAGVAGITGAAAGGALLAASPFFPPLAIGGGVLLGAYVLGRIRGSRSRGGAAATPVTPAATTGTTTGPTGPGGTAAPTPAATTPTTTPATATGATGTATGTTPPPGGAGGGPAAPGAPVFAAPMGIAAANPNIAAQIQARQNQRANARALGITPAQLEHVRQAGIHARPAGTTSRDYINAADNAVGELNTRTGTTPLDLAQRQNAEALAAAMQNVTPEGRRGAIADHIQRRAIARQAYNRAVAANFLASPQEHINSAVEAMRDTDPTRAQLPAGQQVTNNPVVTLREVQAMLSEFPHNRGEILRAFRAAGYAPEALAVVGAETSRARGTARADQVTRVRDGFVASGVMANPRAIDSGQVAAVARALNQAFGEDDATIGIIDRTAPLPTERSQRIVAAIRALAPTNIPLQARVAAETTPGGLDTQMAGALLHFARAGSPRDQVAGVIQQLSDMGFSDAEIRTALTARRIPISNSYEAVNAALASTATTNVEKITAGLNALSGGRSTADIGDSILAMRGALTNVQNAEIREAVSMLGLTPTENAEVARVVLEGQMRSLGTSPTPSQIDNAVRLAIAASGIPNQRGRAFAPGDPVSDTINHLIAQVVTYNAGVPGARPPIPRAAHPITNLARILRAELNLDANQIAQIAKERVTAYPTGTTRELALRDLLQGIVDPALSVAEIATITEAVAPNLPTNGGALADIDTVLRGIVPATEVAKRVVIYSRFGVRPTSTDIVRQAIGAGVVDAKLEIEVVQGLIFAKQRDNDIFAAMQTRSGIAGRATVEEITQEAVNAGGNDDEKARRAVLAYAPNNTYGERDQLVEELRDKGVGDAAIRKAMQAPSGRAGLVLGARATIVQQALVSGLRAGEIPAYNPGTGPRNDNWDDLVGQLDRYVASGLIASGYPPARGRAAATELKTKLKEFIETNAGPLHIPAAHPPATGPDPSFIEQLANKVLSDVGN